MVALLAACALLAAGAARFAGAESSTGLEDSSIAAGQSLSGTVAWTVTTKGSVSSVEFWANNHRLGVVGGESPYTFSLDTTQLPQGADALGLAIVGTDGSRITPQIGTVMVTNSSATSPAAVPPALGDSSVKAGQSLSGTVPWTVTTTGPVSSVEFWANNQKLGTVSGASPYTFQLDTSKLRAGGNVLGLAIVGSDGSRVTPQIGTVTVSAADPAPSSTATPTTAATTSTTTTAATAATAASTTPASEASAGLSGAVSTGGGVVPFGTFDSGGVTSEFSDSCNPGDVRVLPGGREGSFAEFTGSSGAHCYGDGSNVRVHLIGFPGMVSQAGGITPGIGPDIDNGSTFYWALSMRIPSSSAMPDFYAGAEIHADYRCAGPAPFNLGTSGGYWVMRVRGSQSCGSGGQTFTQTTFGPPSQPDDNGSNRFTHAWQGASAKIVTGQWYDFLLGFHMEPDGSGWFEAWMNGPGTAGKSVQIVPQTNLPTDYGGVTNYPFLSLYYPTQGGTTYLDYDASAFSASLTTLQNWQNAFTHSW